MSDKSPKNNSYLATLTLHFVTIHIYNKKEVQNEKQLIDFIIKPLTYVKSMFSVSKYPPQ